MVLPLQNSRWRAAPRIDDCATQTSGGYSPSGGCDKYMEKAGVVVKKPLISTGSDAQGAIITRDACKAVRIIRYSVMFSAVTIPTS